MKATTPSLDGAMAMVSLILGGVAWVFLTHGSVGYWCQCIWVGLGFAAFIFPTFRRSLMDLLDRHRQPTLQARMTIALTVTVLAMAYLFLNASQSDSLAFPFNHDEASFLTQAQILATGRLWMPQHPMADFFETFYVFSRPVYGSLYFPGHAMTLVPAVWLHLPYWVATIVSGGMVVGLMYWVVSELTDGIWGVVAAISLVALREVRLNAGAAFSQSTYLLMAMLAICAWLQWRKNLESRKYVMWAAGIGCFSGWATITRLADAAALFSVLGIVMLFDMWRQPWRTRLATVGALGAAAAPFIAVQLFLNYGVTGDLMKTPATFYSEQQWPNVPFLGFRPYDPNVHATSRLPQAQVFFERIMRPSVIEHRTDCIVSKLFADRLPTVLRACIPWGPLVLFLPLGLYVSGRDRRLWFLTGYLFSFLSVYAFFRFFHDRYAAVLIPSVLILNLVGVRDFAQRWQGHRRPVEAALVLMCVLASLLALPQVSGFASDRRRELPTLEANAFAIPYAVQKPAVVLFRYRATDDPFQEPVYNYDVAWPDDAPIIRAHDLGERNGEIINYYAERQPERTFYLFDRRANTLFKLGKAADLAKRFPVVSYRNAAGDCSHGPAIAAGVAFRLREQLSDATWGRTAPGTPARE